MNVSDWPRDIFIKYNEEQIGWLQKCFERILSGEELKPDPFYARTSLFTAEKVDEIIKVIDDKYEVELNGPVGYHLNIYQIKHTEATKYEVGRARLRPPEFGKLSPAQKLAIVQGMDRIVVKYREIAKKQAEENPSEPLSTVDEYILYG